MPRKDQEDGETILSPQQQQDQAQSANWKVDNNNSSPSKNSNDLNLKSNTLQQPTTPIMPKKVSFAAEVDEQQERINKENMRRDACCVIQ